VLRGKTLRGCIESSLRLVCRPRPGDTDVLNALPTTFVAQFSHGFRLPFRGAALLFRERSLLVWAVVPVLLNLALLVLAVVLAVTGGPALLGLVWPHPNGAGMRTLWVMAAVLTVVALVLVGSAVLYALSGILATPFNDTLSERVERHFIEGSPPKVPFAVLLHDVLVSAAHSAASLAIYLVVMGVLLLLALIPVAGSAVFTVLGSASTAVFLARDLLDGPLTRRRYGYLEKLRVLNENRALTFGLGSASALLTWLPLAGVLLMPFAVAGGAILASELDRAGRIRTVNAVFPTGPAGGRSALL
jgi:CysZ protein